jgi:hypothetical protein
VSDIVANAREHQRSDPQGFVSKQYYAGLLSKWMDIVVWPQVACVYELAKAGFSLSSPTKVAGPVVFERLASIFGNRWALLVAAAAFFWGLKTTRAILNRRMAQRLQ